MTTHFATAPRRLGTSDLTVSAVGLGGNTFGPPRLDEPATRRVLHTALDLGINFVDTANVYGQGHSEQFIGRALGRRRDEMVIATKFNLLHVGTESVSDRIRAHAEQSLRQLGTDRIDLYQLHLPEPGVPAEEILTALDQLVAAGKVRALGACNYSAWRLAEAAHVASELGTARFVSVQNYHHLLARQATAEVLPFCAEYELSLLPYHPLAGGFLTGKYRLGEPPPPGSRGAAGSGIVTVMDTERNHRTLAELIRFAEQRGRTVGELAIAWLLANPLVGSVITGVSTPEQLRANVAASEWQLTGEDIREVTALLDKQDTVPDPERPPYGRPLKLSSTATGGGTAAGAGGR